MAGISRAPIISPTSAQLWVSLLDQSSLGPGATSIAFGGLWNDLYQRIEIRIGNFTISPSGTLAIQLRNGGANVGASLTLNLTNSTIFQSSVTLWKFDGSNRYGISAFTRPAIAGEPFEQAIGGGSNAANDGFILSSNNTITSIGRVQVDGLLA